MNLGLFEQRRLSRDRRPELPDLLARSANVAKPDGMVRRRPDPFAKPNVCDKAQFTVYDAKDTLLGIQKKLLHCNHVARHLTTNFPSPQTSFWPLAACRIGCLGNAQDACADSVLACAAANDKVGAN